MPRHISRLVVVLLQLCEGKELLWYWNCSQRKLITASEMCKNLFIAATHIEIDSSTASALWGEGATLILELLSRKVSLRPPFWLSSPGWMRRLRWDRLFRRIRRALGFCEAMPKIPFALKRPTTKSTGFGIAALVSTKSFLGDPSAVPMTNLRSMFRLLAW